MAGFLMGCGIVTMHFTGMAAMTGDMVQSYEVSLVLLSAVIAIGASVAALWFTTRPYKPVRCVIAALVMGIAICGMHYVGMHAAQFRVTPGETMHQAEFDGTGI